MLAAAAQIAPDWRKLDSSSGRQVCLQAFWPTSEKLDSSSGCQVCLQAPWPTPRLMSAGRASSTTEADATPDKPRGTQRLPAPTIMAATLRQQHLSARWRRIASSLLHQQSRRTRHALLAVYFWRPRRWRAFVYQLLEQRRRSRSRVQADPRVVVLRSTWLVVPLNRRAG